ncbi:MAG: nucleotidyltransferase family protein [Pseudomonadota bacterium]|nr:nucleotidyltransferase family protein [Pseudomonadota bacterium]
MTDAPEPHGAALLLAAGGSTRFGSDKRKLIFNEEPLLSYVVALYERVCPRVLVVVKPGDESVQGLVNGSCGWVVARDANVGISRSIAAGIRALGSAPWVIIGLADMPYVSPDTISQIACTLDAGAVIARPSSSGRAGNPVGFNSRLFGPLMDLKGDRGARTLIDDYLGDVVDVEVRDEGIFRDIDRPKDLT